MSQFQPLLTRIYDIGESLKLKFTLTTAQPGTKDCVLVEVLAEPSSYLLSLATLNPDRIDEAFHQFEIDRLMFFKKHLPHRYKAIVQ